MIGAHLVVVACLRSIMIRAGVNTWIVLSLCTLTLVLGAGQPDVAWGFQVTITGSLAFALLALLLVDQPMRSDPFSWSRGILASLCIVGSVLCSGIGVVMLFAIGAVAAIRSGFRRTAAIIAAPIATYGGWVLIAPPSENSPPPAAPGRALAFAARLGEYTVIRVGGSPRIGWALFTTFAVGTAMLVSQTSWHLFQTRYLTTFVLLASAGLTAASIGRTRAEILEPDNPRYIYIVAVLAVPAVAVALDRLTRDRAPLLAAGCLLVLAAVPANIRALAPDPFRAGTPDRVYALAQQGHRLGVRRDHRPFPTVGADVTIGYLAKAYREGRTRELPPNHPLEAALLEIALITTADVWGLLCPEPEPAPEHFRLEVGDRFHTRNVPVEVFRKHSPAAGSVTIPADTTVEAAWGPLDLVRVGDGATLLCGG